MKRVGSLPFSRTARERCCVQVDCSRSLKAFATATACARSAIRRVPATGAYRSWPENGRVTRKVGPPEALQAARWHFERNAL